MSTRRYHLHSTEFKIRLVQSYLAGEVTLKGLARQHGIYHSLLQLWVDKYQLGPGLRPYRSRPALGG